MGAPKVGKSFLMAQLAYHVGMGLSLWGYEVRQGTVLYLALEDNHRRLQERLYRMFGVESTGKAPMTSTCLYWTIRRNSGQKKSPSWRQSRRRKKARWRARNGGSKNWPRR